MIEQFQKLTSEEVNTLMKAPVLISVSEAASRKGANQRQKVDAIKLSHLKPSTANPLLIPFYREVEKHFQEEFEAAVKEYMPFDQEKMLKLKKEINRIKPVVKKLDPEYARILLRSFEKYERHVKRAGHSFVEDFIFPIPISGLSD